MPWLYKYSSIYLKIGLILALALFILAFVFALMAVPPTAANYHLYKYCVRSASTALTVLSLAFAGAFFIAHYEKNI